MSKPLLQAQQLYKSYQLGRTELKVLRGASLSAEPGEFIAVMGASGSGKSTLLHLLGLLDAPDRGEILFEGRSLLRLDAAEQHRLRNEVFGFVFQFYHLLPELNVLENVALPPMAGVPAWRWPQRRAEAQRAALEILEHVGLAGRTRHRPSELSGGERQRVAIARALVNRPRVLLADEPTGNLDAVTGREILRLLRTLNEQGQTIVMVTHDPDVAGYAHRIVQLVDGKVRPAGGRSGQDRAEDPGRESRG